MRASEQAANPEIEVLYPGEIHGLLQTDIFPSLRYLSLAKNQLLELELPLERPFVPLKELVLDFNKFTDVSALQVLMPSLPSLSAISFQANRIDSIRRSPGTVPGDWNIFPSIEKLNIAQNNLKHWSDVDDISRTFTALRSLRINGNPFYDQKLHQTFRSVKTTAGDVLELADSQDRLTEDTQFILTLARIANLKTLNHSAVTAQDRLNGELYYLTLIEKELQAEKAGDILEHHHRYNELCAKYDREQKSKPKNGKAQNQPSPGSLASKLLKVQFRLQADQTCNVQKTFDCIIPMTMDIYRLKGLVSREFGLPPLSFRLIRDSNSTLSQIPQGTKDDSEDEWSSDADERSTLGPNSRNSGSSVSGALFEWKRHDTELVSSTQDLSYFIENDVHDVQIRIETL
ncbi:MAG: hypothetical protein Q9227_006387 [Pyrenula ochraceoflavens]